MGMGTYSSISMNITKLLFTSLELNQNYTMTGTEKFVNSGWIWPEGLAPSGVPSISSFTNTFENPGTYDYICVIHPWMTGIITVTQNRLILLYFWIFTKFF